MDFTEFHCYYQILSALLKKYVSFCNEIRGLRFKNGMLDYGDIEWLDYGYSKFTEATMVFSLQLMVFSLQ